MRSAWMSILQPRTHRCQGPSRGFLLIAILGLLQMPVAAAAAQVSDQVIILSPRVGEVIDSKERELYHLFPGIHDFREAVFYRTPANACYVLVRRTSGADTTIALSESALMEASQFIDTREATERESCRPDSTVVKKTVVDAGSLRSASEKNPPAQRSPSGSLSQAIPPAGRNPKDDLLPFAGNDKPAHYPSFGIGLGVGMYHSEMTGVEAAFAAIEDGYRAAGASVPRVATIDLDPMQLLTISFRPNNTFLFACEAGFSGNEFKNSISTKVKMIGGLAYAHYAPGANRMLTLFAGLGGGACRFSMTKPYNATLASYNDGSRDILKHISLNGGGSYFTTSGGLTFHMAPQAAFEIFAQHVSMKTVSTVTPEGPVSVDLAGTIFGVRLTLFR